MSYTFSNGYELDAFAQMFSPSLLSGQNTPYKLIADYVVFAFQRLFPNRLKGTAR